MWGRRIKPELLMEVTPVIMLHMMSGSTIIFSRLRNTSPNNAITLMTCSACESKPPREPRVESAIVILSFG